MICENSTQILGSINTSCHSAEVHTESLLPPRDSGSQVRAERGGAQHNSPTLGY